MHTEETSNNHPPAAEVPTTQPEDTGSTQTEAPAKPAEPQHIQDLRTAFALALATPDFTGDKKRVEKATAALTLPNPENRVRAQLTSSSLKILKAKKADEAFRTNTPYVPPTQEEVNTRVERGVQEWRDKQGR